MAILVTGGAGFIGSHLCERLVARGHAVVAVDSFDPFYDPAVKRRNLASLERSGCFALVEADILEPERIGAALDGLGVEVDTVVHLAGRPGVRPSIDDPRGCTDVNVSGTVAMLELARRRGAGFVFGSSSSVYGNSARVRFTESDAAVHPISPYAASKRAGELLCHTYSHLYGTAAVCLRLFTVYGPRQRPDLAIHLFARLMAAGQPVPVYGDGTAERAYTYVDDVVDGVAAAIRYTAEHPGVCEVFNLGQGRAVPLLELVERLGDALGVKAAVRMLPSQPGDVLRTCADVRKARRLLGYVPRTPLAEGLRHFAAWFRRERET